MKKKGLFRVRIEYDDIPLCDSKVNDKDLDATIEKIKRKVL